MTERAGRRLLRVADRSARWLGRTLDRFIEDMQRGLESVADPANWPGWRG